MTSFQVRFISDILNLGGKYQYRFWRRNKKDLYMLYDRRCSFRFSIKCHLFYTEERLDFSIFIWLSFDVTV